MNASTTHIIILTVHPTIYTFRTWKSVCNYYDMDAIILFVSYTDILRLIFTIENNQKIHTDKSIRSESYCPSKIISYSFVIIVNGSMYGLVCLLSPTLYAYQFQVLYRAPNKYTHIMYIFTYQLYSQSTLVVRYTFNSNSSGQFMYAPLFLSYLLYKSELFANFTDVELKIMET